MAWSKNGTTTLSSAGDTVTVSSLTATDFGMTLSHNLQSGTVRPAMKINSATSGYANRYSENGATDSTSVNRGNYLIDLTQASYDDFIILYNCGIQTEEKLFIEFYVDSNTSGAGNAPNRTEGVGKYADTSNTISSIEIFNTETSIGDWAIGSNLTVLNGDTTEEVILGNNLQSGSRFEATDTRKIYYAGGMSKSGIKAYYNFEQTSGSLTNQATTGNGFSDGLGSSADGTVTGATQNATGKVGSYAYSFDGSNDTVQLGSSYSDLNFLHDGSSWSIVFWLKDDNSSQTSRIFSTMDDRSGSQRGISLVHDTTGFNLGVYTGTAGQYPFASTIASVFTDTNTWHHYVLTFTTGGSTATLYKDGSSFGTWTKTGASFNTSNATQYPYIASRFGNDSFMGGDIDEFVIFNRALTSSEVSYLYNSGTGRTVNSTDVLGWTEEA